MFDSYQTRRSLSDERRSALGKETIEIGYKGVRYTEQTEIARANYAYYSVLFGGSSGLDRKLGFRALIDSLSRHADDECTAVSGPIAVEEFKTESLRSDLARPLDQMA